MEKLLQLINEHENRDFSLDEELEEWAYIVPSKVWTEFEWHLRFNNANIVQFPNEMFDYYAISKEYGFIHWLVEHNKISLSRFGDNQIPEAVIAVLATEDNPIQTLIDLM